MPSDVKERLKDYILSDMHDKIATENDVTSVDEHDGIPPGTSPPGPCPDNSGGNAFSGYYRACYRQ